MVIFNWFNDFSKGEAGKGTVSNELGVHPENVGEDTAESFGKWVHHANLGRR